MVVIIRLLGCRRYAGVRCVGLALAVMMLLLVAGCGGGDGASGLTNATGGDDPVPPVPLSVDDCWLASTDQTMLGSYRFVGENAGDRAGWSLSPAGDIDGDGCADLIMGAPNYPGGDGAGAVYLVATSDLAAADAADGATDGDIGLGHLKAQPNSWLLTGENRHDHTGGRVAAVASAALYP